MRSYNIIGGHTTTTDRQSTSEWIRQVLSRGESEAGRFLLLRFLKRSDQQADAAFVISRKIGKAVVRNKIRRRLRECFRRQKRSFIVPGYYLFIARTASAEATFKQLEDEMAALVKNAQGMKAAMPDHHGMKPEHG